MATLTLNLKKRVLGCVLLVAIAPAQAQNKPNIFQACQSSWQALISTPGRIQAAVQRKILSTKVGAKASLLSGNATRELAPEIYDIFEQARKNPDWAPGVEERARVEEAGYGKLFDEYQSAGRLVRELNATVARISRSKPGDLKGLSVGRAALGTVRWVLPGIPEPSKRKIEAIYEKLRKNPKYAPTASERALLAHEKLTTDFERYRSDLKWHGPSFAALSKIRQVGDVAKWTVVTSALTLGLYGNHYISAAESYSEASRVGMSRYDDKVELVFLSPIPHASIRIGGLVYNYGAFVSNRYTLDQFRSMTGFGDQLSGSHTRIELNLTEEERAKLRAYLEEDVGKVYPLVFPYNDCVSMTNKALNAATGIDVPPIADRSQAGTIAYLKLLKVLGNKKVGDVTFAAHDGNPLLSKSLDTGVNALDSLFFLKHAASMLLVTCGLDQSRLTKEVR